VLQGRVDRARELERDAARASQKRLKEQAQRRALVLMVQSAHPLLVALMQAWVDAIRQRRESEAKAKRHVRSRVFLTWRRLTGVQKVQKLRTVLEDTEKTHAAELRRHQQLRQAVSNLTFDNPTSWLQVAWSCWCECRQEALRAKERETEQQEWQRQWEERHKELVGRERIRAVLLAARQTSGPLLRVTWSSWLELVSEAQRDDRLEGKQRVFEDDMRKREAMVRERETKLLEATGDKQMRNVLCLRSLHESDELHLWYAWSAWRGCWQDARAREISELRQKLEELKTSKPTRGAERALRFLNENNELHLWYAWSAWRECLQDAQKLEVNELRQKLEQLRNLKPFKEAFMDAAGHPTSGPDDIVQPVDVPKPGCCRRLCRGLRSIMCPCAAARTSPMKAKTLEINQQPQLVNCQGGHTMVQVTSQSSWVCDGCHKSIRSVKMQRLRCEQCSYDLCTRCAARKSPTGAMDTTQSTDNAGEHSPQAELHVPDAAD